MIGLKVKTSGKFFVRISFDLSIHLPSSNILADNALLLGKSKKFWQNYNILTFMKYYCANKKLYELNKYNSMKSLCHHINYYIKNINQNETGFNIFILERYFILRIKDNNHYEYTLIILYYKKPYFSI